MSDYIYRMNRTEGGRQAMMCSFAALDDKAVKIVERVESETGTTILAYDCFAAEAIGEEEIRKIRGAGKELCRTLVAVKAEH
jgi:hypothetical protein